MQITKKKLPQKKIEDNFFRRFIAETEIIYEEVKNFYGKS